MNARRGIVSGLIMAAAIAAVAASGPTAQALGKKSDDINRETVKYGDLNLHEKRDVKKLLWRIRRAAVRVCGGNSGTPRAYARRKRPSFHQCVDASVVRAIDTLAGNLTQRADKAMSAGNFDSAEDLHLRNLTLHQVLERQEGEIAQLGKLAEVALKRADFEAAEEWHARAFALNQELGRKEAALYDLDRMGWIARKRADLATADNHYRRALALSAELSRNEDMAAHIRNLGTLAWMRGDFETAETLHRSSLALDAEAGRKEGVASSLASLGQIARSRGDADAAWEFHNHALTVNEELGRKEHMAALHGNLGALALEQNRLDEAEEHLRQSLRFNREAGIVSDAPAAGEVQMGVIRQVRGQKTEACAAWGRAQEIYRHAGNEAEAVRVGNMMRDSLCDAGGKPAVTAALQE
jgi:UrcA family protein